MSGLISVIKDAFREWREDDAFSDSASIAYYSILSLPGFIFLIVYLLSFFFGEQAAQGKISEQVNQVIGSNSAEFIETFIQNSSQSSGLSMALLIGLVTIGLSSIAVFLQVQKVLNKIWGIKPASTIKSGILLLIFNRLISFGLIIAIGVLIIVSILIASAVTVLKGWIASVLPNISIYVFYGLSFGISFLLFAVFFAILYKFLPDAKIEWKAVRVGASITALLFIAGMIGLQFYFSIANPASAYGAAGSVILILVWTYYSSLIFLLGAEFTKVYARKYTRGILPSKYAVKI